MGNLNFSCVKLSTMKKETGSSGLNILKLCIDHVVLGTGLIINHVVKITTRKSRHSLYSDCENARILNSCLD